MTARRRKPSSDQDHKVQQPRQSAVVTGEQLRWKQEVWYNSDVWNKRFQYEDDMTSLLAMYEQDDILLASDENSQPSNESDERSEDRNLASAALYLNIFSLIANLIASYLSGSLSVLSTFVDSSMDISCSFVMNMCLQLISKSDQFNYPRGRERLELVGVVICSVLMAFANVSMILQALNGMKTDSAAPVMGTVTILLMVVQTSLKGLLSYICYCRNSTSSMVVAMDLRNDVITRILALLFGYLGDHYWRLADPIGAIIVCSLIAVSWCQNAMEHIPTLVGRRSDRHHISRVLRIATLHDRRIKKIDHIMVYHTGEQALVELHIVMDEHLPLKVTHDISHPLEKKLQRLPFVERAFVHCDYDCDGD